MKHKERVAQLEKALDFANTHCQTADKKTGQGTPLERWELREYIQTLAHEVHRLRKIERNGR